MIHTTYRVSLVYPILFTSIDPHHRSETEWPRRKEFHRRLQIQHLLVLMILCRSTVSEDLSLNQNTERAREWNAEWVKRLILWFLIPSHSQTFILLFLSRHELDLVVETARYRTIEMDAINAESTQRFSEGESIDAPPLEGILSDRSDCWKLQNVLYI